MIKKENTALVNENEMQNTVGFHIWDSELIVEQKKKKNTCIWLFALNMDSLFHCHYSLKNTLEQLFIITYI